MRIVQISDLHVLSEGTLASGYFNTNARLRTAIEHINKLAPQPDLVIATGDLVDGGTIEEYRILRQILAALKAPILLLRGNHDDLGNLRTVFADHDYLQADGEHLQYASIAGGIRIVALDSLRAGTHHGGYCIARAAWLDAALSDETNTPTLIAMHHPPFETGLRSFDRYGFDGIDQLTEVIQKHRQVRWLICGHIHRTMTSTWAGILALSVGSTSHQLDLDFIDQDYRVGGEPPVCRILDLDVDGTGRSHASLIGEFPLIPDSSAHGPHRCSRQSSWQSQQFERRITWPSLEAAP